MRPIARRSRPSVLAALSLLYGAGVMAWDVLRFTRVGDWWPFELVDIFGVWFFAPLLLLGVLALLLRDGWASAWLILPVVVFAWDYGPLFLPRAVAAEGMPLRVMTTNVLVSNGNVAGLGAVLAQNRPDVVAIQELSEEVATYADGQLRSQYPYQVLWPSDSSFGLGVLSRYPLRVDQPGEAGADDGCFCQQVSIDLADRSVTVLNVHPSSPAVRFARLRGLPVPRRFSADRTEGPLRAALVRVDTISEPLIALGDFNTADRQPLYRQIRRRLQDAHREAGWGFGFTWPNQAVRGLPLPPVVRIDYIFHDDAWAARAAWTGTLPGSDHRYVVADLVLR